MKISRQDIIYLAQLSKLAFSEDEIVKYQEEIDSVISYLDQLADIDTKDLEPTSQVTGLENISRKDEVKDVDKQLDSAETQDGYIKTKRVL